MNIGAQITAQLRENLSIFTEEFSTLVTATSLTQTAGTATCVTSTVHGKSTGGFVTVKGSEYQIALASLTRVGNTVTAVTSVDHSLQEPSLFGSDISGELTVTIQDAIPAAYNGEFKLLTVPDRTTFTYLIIATPVTPATTPGNMIEDSGYPSAAPSYNGNHQITVVNTTTFTFPVNSSLGAITQGTIEVKLSDRIHKSAAADRATAYYTVDKNRELQNWMFVVLGGQRTDKGGISTTDIQSLIDENQEYAYTYIQDFSIYTYVPTAVNQILGEEASDFARNLLPLLLKTISKFSLTSSFCEGTTQPIIYISDTPDEYNTAYYVHRYDFSFTGRIEELDTFQKDRGALIKKIELDIIGKEDFDATVTYDT